MARILIVEDEREMARGLKDLLEYEQHDVLLAREGREALAMFRSGTPDLVLLDLMLPDMDGMDVCRGIRKENATVPVVMLTARGQEHDIVRGFEAGADDYVTKPFSVAELLARIKAIIRRIQIPIEGNKILIIGPNQIDTGTFVLRRGRMEIPLTFYEVEILKYLHLNRNQPVSREVLYRKVWGLASDPTSRTVDNFIAKLRKKIELNQKKPEHLITVYGKGYKMVTDA